MDLRKAPLCKKPTSAIGHLVFTKIALTNGLGADHPENQAPLSTYFQSNRLLPRSSSFYSESGNVTFPLINNLKLPAVPPAELPGRLYRLFLTNFISRDTALRCEEALLGFRPARRDWH